MLLMMNYEDLKIPQSRFRDNVIFAMMAKL